MIIESGFAARARRWIEATLPPRDQAPVDSHELQRLLFDGGFAGIAFPAEYGGAGLTLEHQKVFYDLADALERQLPAGYELQVSIAMLGPTILDHGSDAAKRRFLPPLLRGDEVWIQLLSEPRGGSDMAGAMTRLTADGDTYVLNGAKMWSTGAATADYGLCLCRSDWDVPKHRGLSTIAVPLKDTAGLTVQRIRAANGLPGDFCQEFFDDLVLPAANLIGAENQGWAVAQTLLLHERNAAGNIGHGYLGAHERVQDSQPVVMSADTYIESIVGALTSARIMTGLRVGTHTGQWGSLSKLQSSVAKHQALRTALAVRGADGVIWDGTDVQVDNIGTTWLGARGGTLAGGSNEMQRNIVSERLLGLPREPSVDREVPWNEVLRNLGRFGA